MSWTGLVAGALLLSIWRQPHQNGWMTMLGWHSTAWCAVCVYATAYGRIQFSKTIFIIWNLCLVDVLRFYIFFLLFCLFAVFTSHLVLPIPISIRLGTKILYLPAFFFLFSSSKCMCNMCAKMNKINFLMWILYLQIFLIPRLYSSDGGGGDVAALIVWFVKRRLCHPHRDTHICIFP